MWLKRAFSMLDKEDLEVDLNQLDSMAKVGLEWLPGVCCLPSAWDKNSTCSRCSACHRWKALRAAASAGWHLV